MSRPPEPPVGRYLLVELREDLAAKCTTLRAVYLGLLFVPGVLDVTDLAAISQTTLQHMLRPPEKKRRRAA